jgi:hypothetical protein
MRVGASKPIFIFGFLVASPHWAFSHYHMAAHDWATWKPPIGPRHPLVQSTCHILCMPRMVRMPRVFLVPYDLPHGFMDATWHFLIGPHVDLKMSKMSDMWQPLVLLHHHDDVSMTHVMLCMCHIHCMDVDIICIDDDVSSTMLTHLC